MGSLCDMPSPQSHHANIVTSHFFSLFGCGKKLNLNLLIFRVIAVAAADECVTHRNENKR